MLALLGRGVLNAKHNVPPKKLSFADAARPSLPQTQHLKSPKKPGAFGPIIEMKSPQVNVEDSSDGELSEAEEHGPARNWPTTHVQK